MLILVAFENCIINMGQWWCFALVKFQGLWNTGSEAQLLKKAIGCSALWMPALTKLERYRGYDTTFISLIIYQSRWFILLVNLMKSLCLDILLYIDWGVGELCLSTSKLNFSVGGLCLFTSKLNFSVGGSAYPSASWIYFEEVWITLLSVVQGWSCKEKLGHLCGFFFYA